MTMKTFAIASIAIAGMALTACSQGTSPAPGDTAPGDSTPDSTATSEQTEAAATAEIRFGSPDTGPGAEFLQTVVDRYNESQDEVEVTLENYGSAFDQKVAAQLGAGNAPDILKVWNFPQYHQALVPLDDMINAMEDKDDFYPALFNYATVDGKIYGFPTGFSTRAIYYNKDLAEQAGLTPQDEWSQEDFTEWVTKLGELGGGVYGTVMPTNPDPYAIESFLVNGGGEWLDADGNPVANSEANKKVLTYLHDLAYEEPTAPYVRKVASSEDNSKVFIASQLGTLEFGKWFTDAFDEAGVSYGIVPPFTWDGAPPKSVVHAAFLSVNKDSQNIEAAQDFITWYASPENVKAAAAYDQPIRESVADELGLTEDEIAKPFFDVLANSSDVTSSMLKNTNWPVISGEIAKTLEAIFSTADADVSAELDELQTTLESL